MSSRPRRSCARGDTSVLSPSTIFLWSDTRLRQELARRGLSRVGIRQDLIDRLLNAINGVVTEESSNWSGTTGENVILETVSNTKADVNVIEESVITVASEVDAEPLKKKGKRGITTKADSTLQPKQKGSKPNVSPERPLSPRISDQLPVLPSWKQHQPRASAGEDPVFVKEAHADFSTSVSAHTSADPSPTCSIMKPLLSILPKVRPILSTTLSNESTTAGAVHGPSTDSSVSTKASSKSSESAASASTSLNNDIYDSQSGEESSNGGKLQIAVKRTFADSSASAQGANQALKKSGPQKVEEDRHCPKRFQGVSSTSAVSKAERIGTLKPITEAWAERLAELKKANPEKFSIGTTLVEKRKLRDSEVHKKPVSSKPSAVSGGTVGNSSKKPSVSTNKVSSNRLDLLDSIMNQQSEFLQTMRKLDERISPVDDLELIVRNDHTDSNIGNASVDRPRDMSSAAEEAYRRYELSCADSSSDKSSPRSPQILPPPPPPPPPRKLSALQKCSHKLSNTVSVDMSQLLVPPPPPPPPQLPPKEIPPPPPPPPRRLRTNAIEDLPPPPPPPKRLKPARLCPPAKLLLEKDSTVTVEVKREIPSPDENTRAEQLAIFADVKTCLEHVVFLVSSIKPFDEISGELLPVVEVPIPFSQRSVSQESHNASSSVNNTELSKVCYDSNNSEKSKVTINKNVEEFDEEYDPLDTSVVEEFETYVPSAVVSRNVTFDELDSSLNLPDPAVSTEEEQSSNRSPEQYSPRPQTAEPLDEDLDEGEILDDTDSGSMQSLSDDSDDDSDCEDGDLQKKSVFREYESGKFVKILRRTRKGNRRVLSNELPPAGEVNPIAIQTQSTAEDVEVEEKPDPKILNDPRHLLQRASAVLKGLGCGQGNQYIQIPYDDDYEEEVCIQPMDSFHGEPVPDDDELFEVAAGMRPKRKEEVIIEEKIPESTEKFEIDFYNGDLHLKGSSNDDWIIDPDNQDGLALMWGGVRSTHGIFSSCRKNGNPMPDEQSLNSVVFQVKIIDLLPTKHLPFDELDPNDVRVGFSLRSAPLLLGEYPGTYCYTSLGKRANNNIFVDYGDSFGVGDVITARMDFDSGVISFWKNSQDMGVAYANIAISDDEAIYPHICVKNCRVSVNFGTFPGGEEEWINNSEWNFPNSFSRSQTERAPLPPESKSDCTVLMMVGLPSVGKTTWVRRYIREHPSENWTLISADTILASMKVNGVSRNSSHIGRWDMVLGLVGKARNRLLSLAARRRRNYILDFTNCDPDTRKKRLALFEGFFRQCVTIVPSDEVMQQRHARHLRQNRGEGTAAVPIETFLELKAVMEMPVVSEFLESVIYVDPAMEDAQIAIDRIAKFNEEGRPWYSSKYNKKRGFWSGSYGDEPFRKSSTTNTRTATVSAVEKTHLTDTFAASTTESGSPTTGSKTDSQNITPVIHSDEQATAMDEEVNRPTSEFVTAAISSEMNACPSAQVSKSSSTSVPSTVKFASAPQIVPNSIPPVFNHPPPKLSPIVQSTKPFIEPSNIPQLPTVPVIAPTSQKCPFATQISTISPRSKWDTPPPVLPNFSVPPPSLVTPNLYTPSTMHVAPAMIPFIPNTSIPPPNIPPPGWPHHLG